MKIDKSVTLILILCLTFSSCLAEGNFEEGIENLRKPVSIANESNVPIRSRILDKPIDKKIATIENVDKNVSTAKKLTIVDKGSSEKIVDFKPSIHIGEIEEYEPKKSVDFPKSSFEKSESVKFENNLRTDKSSNTDRSPGATPSITDNQRSNSPGSIVERKNLPVKFYDTDGRYGIALPVDILRKNNYYYRIEEQPEVPRNVNVQFPVEGIIHQDEKENVRNDENENSDGTGSEETLVTFEDPRSTGYGSVTAFKSVLPSVIRQRPIFEHHLQNYQLPAGSVETFYAKPSKLQEEDVKNIPNAIYLQNYEYHFPSSGEVIEKPEVPNYHQYQTGNYQHYSPYENSVKNVVKPETTIYVTSHRQSAFTRMQKFPYKFYEPSMIEQQDFHSIRETPHSFPVAETRISPWKKIIHLIGAFLPLGLILAALKPNFVKVENTTQPNIILSKLRVIDLPAEHKNARLMENEEEKNWEETCDDKSICESIVSGSEPTSNLLQNILWNLTNKSSDEEARKHGLHEIFSAAKKKDCSLIDC